jgi:hypothetical protein
LGEYDAAYSAAAEAYAIAERHQFGGTALAAADDISAVLLESGDIPGAARWCGIASNWAEAVDASYIKASQRFTHARVHVAQSEEDHARRVFPFALTEILDDTELRRQSDSLALWLRLNPSRTPEGERALALMLQLHSRTRGIGGQDFSTYCLCHTLYRREETESAHSLLCEYALQHRREASPLPYYLSDLLISLAQHRDRSDPPAGPSTLLRRRAGSEA